MNARTTLGYRWTRVMGWIAAVGAASVLAACGGGGGATTADGSLRVALTDAPSCGYDHVYVTIQKVSVNQSSTASETDSGWTDLTLTPARQVDLLTLTNGVLEELGSMPLAAGHYSQIRLVLADNTGTGSSALANAVQPTGGALTALTTPSGQQSGLKLQANFDVLPGQMADVVLDFNACASIVKAGNSGQYILKPVISVIERLVSGLQGFVSTTLATASTTVSAQLNGATVRSTAPDSTGKFTIPYLAPGTYTLVVTSDGHATGVVTSVPVGTTTTVINGTATAILTPVSAMADVTGAVTAVSGSSTVAVTDASARALQALTGGPTIEVAKQPVDSTLGTYRFHLPVAAPVKAPYATTGLTFAADMAVAGKYTIEIQAPSRTTQTKPADISSGTGATVNFAY
ncbi:MAG: DUF4382 domain-containing protein [Ramlibacter sp.]